MQEKVEKFTNHIAHFWTILDKNTQKRILWAEKKTQFLEARNVFLFGRIETEIYRPLKEQEWSRSPFYRHSDCKQKTFHEPNNLYILNLSMARLITTTFSLCNFSWISITKSRMHRKNNLHSKTRNLGYTTIFWIFFFFLFFWEFFGMNFWEDFWEEFFGRIFLGGILC